MKLKIKIFFIATTIGLSMLQVPHAYTQTLNITQPIESEKTATQEPITLKRPDNLIKPIIPPVQEKGAVPLIITADGSLDWDRNNKLFIARDNAIAQHGDSKIHASILKANYRDSKDGGIEIHHVTAEDHVIIDSQESRAFGQIAVYNLDTSLATMTGNNLKLISPDQTITAKDRFEYHVNKGLLRALGAAKAVRPKPEGGNDILEADIIAATLKTNEKGERVLDTLQAIGHVVITTPTETITGRQGIYRSSTNMAELVGGITIRRGPNILQGQRAVIDMNTSTSQLFGDLSPQGSGRVRGVFYPSNTEKK